MVIFDILNNYEIASSHKVNIEKSNISFSKGVSIVRKDELIDFLAMRLIERHIR